MSASRSPNSASAYGIDVDDNLASVLPAPTTIDRRPSHRLTAVGLPQAAHHEAAHVCEITLAHRPEPRRPVTPAGPSEVARGIEEASLAEPLSGAVRAAPLRRVGLCWEREERPVAAGRPQSGRHAAGAPRFSGGAVASCLSWPAEGYARRPCRSCRAMPAC